MNNHTSAPVAAQPQPVDLKAEALALAARGWPVFPTLGDKSPAIAGGFKNASCDPTKVAAMPWHNAAGIGIAGGTTPEGHHLLCVDLDTPKGGATLGEDDPASRTFAELRARLVATGRPFVLTTTPSGGRHLWFRTDQPVKSRTDVLKTKATGCAIDLRGAGGYAVGAGAAWFDRDGKLTNNRRAVQEDGSTRPYAMMPSPPPAVSDLALIPVTDLAPLGLCWTDGGKPPVGAAKPAPTPAPAGGQAGFIGLGGAGRGSTGPSASAAPTTPLPEGEAASPAPAQPAGGPAAQVPAHIAGALAGGEAPRKLAMERASDPAEVRAALLHVIAAAKAAGEDTTGMDFWRDAVLLPLAGAVARGALPESEARLIFDAASAACGGATDQNEKQWAGAVRLAGERLAAGENVTGLGSIFTKATAAGWVAPGSITSPLGADGGGHGGVRQGAGRQRALTTPDLIAQLAGQPLAFGHNRRTGEHTFDLTAPIEGVALPVGNRQPVDDTAARQIAALLARLTGRDIRPDRAFDVMHTAGDRHSYDPVQDMLAALAANNPWDGTPRLDTWLSAYCGGLDTPLYRQWARLTVLALIARIWKPGCKWDHILTLVGDQGAGKSEVAKAMAFNNDDLFTDHPVLGLEAQKLIEQTRGKLIVEMGELARGRVRELEHDKALVSRTHDEARMAYGRKALKLPRGFIFIGTTNDMQFLSDTTGNRRWWPVKVGAVNLEAFKRDWPQIIVEALQVFAQEFGGDAARVRLDPQWYADATAAQAAFTSPDEIAEDIETMLRQKGPDGAWGVRRVAVGGGLRVSHDDLRNRLDSGPWARLGPSRLGKEINRVMPRLGWLQIKSDGKRQWIQPDGWDAPSPSLEGG